MLAAQPRILHKGLILLAVPLLFEVLAAVGLIYLQHYSGEAVKAEAVTKQIIYHANYLWYDCMHMTTTHISDAFLQKYQLNPFPAKRARREFELLKELVGQDPIQLEQLENMSRLASLSENLSQKLKRVTSESGGRLGQILALKQNLFICKRLIHIDIETGAYIRSFREHEFQRSEKAAEKVRFLSSSIQLVAAGAVVGSTVIAYFLFRYFMQGIHKGINTLTQNIERFKTGDQLLPAFEGTDEIALLDARFHEMANEVAAAQMMKHAFLTTMSRELGAPITSARAYLASLSDGSLGAVPDQAKSRIIQAEQTLDRLIGLINDLLALQDPTGSRMDILPRMCSLGDEVIEPSLVSVSAFADKHGVRLEAQETPALAYADPGRIVQVLINLLSNAIKFSPSGSSVVVTTEEVDNQVEVRVKDSGRGIPAHMLDAVFEQFKQVSTTDATEKGGTGLGLPICKKIIERHGGTIGVDSEEGKGSTFWFRLPLNGGDA